MSCQGCVVPVPGPSIQTLGACGGGSYLLFMALLEGFLRTQCDVEDPCQAITPVPQPDDEYDFIVVGGGSAGSVVASRLSEVKDWKVLVVEAGPNEPTGSQVPSLFLNFLHSPIDWQYYTESEEKACQSNKEKRCYWPRGKVIGGTSVLNGMMYVRGSRKDYDGWEEQGNLGWSYKSVLPYFLKSEDNLQIDKVDKGYHSTGGLLPISYFPYLPPLGRSILEGAKELGLSVGDINGEHHTRFTVVQTLSKNGVRHSSARAFLRPARKRPNLHIMLNTTAARVLMDPTTKKAFGVELIKSDGTYVTVKAKKEVVVSGGAVNSPQILLLSGIGPKEDLTKANVTVVHNLPGVGKNLHNHVCFDVRFHINETATRPLNWATATEYLLTRAGPMSSTGLSQVTGFINSKLANPREDNPDLQLLFFGDFLADCAKTGLVSELTEPAKNGIFPKKLVRFIADLQHPNSRGYITLRDSNPLSHPKIFARYLTEKEDVVRLIDGIKFALKLSKTKALQEYNFTLVTNPADGCEGEEFGSDKYWECALYSETGPENHQGGSCKMGPTSETLAVVDHELKVHGVTSLRVIDASIIPSPTSGNPYATIIMIAEKGSDMIKRSWLKQN